MRFVEFQRITIYDYSVLEILLINYFVFFGNKKLEETTAKKEVE